MRFTGNGSAFDRQASGFGDPVSPHIDRLSAGSDRLGRNCCPPDAQKLCQHLRRNLVGDQRRLGDAAWSSVRQKLKDAATVVVERNRAQLPLRGEFLAVYDLAVERDRHVDARAGQSRTRTIHAGVLRWFFVRQFLKLVDYFHKQQYRQAAAIAPPIRTRVYSAELHPTLTMSVRRGFETPVRKFQGFLRKVAASSQGCTSYSPSCASQSDADMFTSATP